MGADRSRTGIAVDAPPVRTPYRGRGRRLPDRADGGPGSRVPPSPAGGRLVFETRVPAARAWQEWTRERSHRVTEVPGAGSVESWVRLVGVNGPLVTFRWTYVFASDGQVLTSDSTLRFREREEVERDLLAHGFAVEDVRDASDRPGREFVFVARRP